VSLLLRLRNQTSISQCVPVCSRLVPVSPTQGQWGRTLSGTSQWPQMRQSRTCRGSEQIPGIYIQLSRKYHTTNKLPTTKDSPQPVEEKVGALTKIIEAMGFTGPLKYSKWVKCLLYIIVIFKICDIRSRVVAHACNPSTLEGQGGRIP
uniref:Ubiquinol-cytochrome c reductase complex assembly factor 1 n=1 Tax=Prolemur simus TaxID=1328070 RepID=A0A8C9DF57_PROSS